MAFRIQIRWTGLPGLPGISTFYFAQAVSPDPEVLADAVLGTMSGYVGLFDNELQFNYDTEVTTYSTPDTPVDVTNIAPGPTQTGTNTAESIPLASQGLIRWGTGIYVGARQVRGRTFIPGLASTAIGNDGQMNSSAQGQLTLMGNGLIALGLQIASKKNNLFYDVASCSTWDQFAVLRTRRD
jgi:hypothetical protein